MAVMSENQRQRLIDILMSSPTPDLIDVVDKSGNPYHIADVVLVTEKGINELTTTLRIVVDEKE